MKGTNKSRGIVLIVLTLLLGAVIAFEAFSGNEDIFTGKLMFFAMDTVVDVRSESDVTSDIRRIFGEYEKALSRSGKDCETARLNESGSITGSGILCGTLRETLALNEKYGSSADVTVGRLTKLWDYTQPEPKVPDQKEIERCLSTVGYGNILMEGSRVTLKNGAELDFGAVGKGAVLDRCLSFLEENRCGRTIVSTVSSVLFYGCGESETLIRNPDGEGTLALVRTKLPFLSTSGGYERYFEAEGKTYSHIIDPGTGYPADTDLTTVTVFCGSGIMSDFLSTMIFTEGTGGIGRHLRSDDYKIFAADNKNRLYISEGLSYEVCDERYKKQEVSDLP